MNGAASFRSTAGSPRSGAGRMGLRLAVLGLAMGLAAVNTGNNLLYLMLALVLGLAATSTVASRRAMRSLGVVPHLPAEVVSGQPFLAGVEVRGRFPYLPQTWLDVRVEGLPRPIAIEVAVAGPEGRGLGSARTAIERRGVYDGLRATVSTGYPLDLGLSRVTRPIAASLTVLPRFERLERLTLAGAETPGANLPATGPASRAGFDLKDIREHTPSDDARHIDWRSTARTRRLMVREFEPERERCIDLVLDHESPDEASFEPVVARCAAVLDFARRKGIDARLIVPGSDTILEGPAAMRHLAAARAEAPGGRSAAAFARARRRARAGADLIVLSAIPSRATPIEVCR